MNKLRFVDMTYYVLRKDGAYAGVSLWEGYDPRKFIKLQCMMGHGGQRRRWPCLRGIRRIFRRNRRCQRGSDEVHRGNTVLFEVGLRPD